MFSRPGDQTWRSGRGGRFLLEALGRPSAVSLPAVLGAPCLLRVSRTGTLVMALGPALIHGGPACRSFTEDVLGEVTFVGSWVQRWVYLWGHSSTHERPGLRWLPAPDPARQAPRSRDPVESREYGDGAAGGDSPAQRGRLLPSRGRVSLCRPLGATGDGRRTRRGPLCSAQQRLAHRPGAFSPATWAGGKEQWGRP